MKNDAKKRGTAQVAPGKMVSLTMICLKQYNVGYEERAAHFGPRDLIKLTWSEIIAPLPRDTQLSLPVTQSEMRRRTVGRPKVTTTILKDVIGLRG
ncbi:hypothetical protein G5I_07612 [Acromyrmex echinatior]|uniref:Uncharacterized protein n=1 Tax=Acromyrmex echinatior TaxID=103372 RepID=F4WPD7_ACREC|nr:hypothetical protein G5I_07612 [Acromyrmex echinatior]